MPPNVSLFDIFREPLYLESIGASLGLGINSLRKRYLPSKDYSVSEWLYAVSNSRKGAGTLASAMMHGIYGGDIDKLSARCVLDRVYWGWYLPNPGLSARPMPVAEQTLLETLGQDKQIQKMALEPRSVLVDFGDKGMESLPQALSAALREQPNVTIKTGEAVQDVVYNKANQQVHVRYLPLMAWSMSLTAYVRLPVPTPRTSPSTTPRYTIRSSQRCLHKILLVSQETNSLRSQQHTLSLS
jgi:oxygen-dependent protoporphyrinogen oxidase